MWHWNNTLKVSLQTNLLNLINITIPLDILSWMLLLRCDQVNLLSIGLPKCLLCNFFFFIVPISFWCSVLWWLFFYSSKIVQGSLCALGINPPSKTPLPSFLSSPPPLPHLFRQSINCSVRVSCLPQFKIRKSDIFGQKNEVSKTANMWLQGQIDFFYVTLRKCTFSH